MGEPISGLFVGLFLFMAWTDYRGSSNEFYSSDSYDGSFPDVS